VLMLDVVTCAWRAYGRCVSPPNAQTCIQPKAEQQPRRQITPADSKACSFPAHSHPPQEASTTSSHMPTPQKNVTTAVFVTDHLRCRHHDERHSGRPSTVAADQVTAVANSGEPHPLRLLLRVRGAGHSAAASALRLNRQDPPPLMLLRVVRSSGPARERPRALPLNVWVVDHSASPARAEHSQRPRVRRSASRGSSPR